MIDALINVRSGLESAQGTWSASVFCNNLTDKYYWTQATKVYDTTVRYAGMPRIVGLSVGYRFFAL